MGNGNGNTYTEMWENENEQPIKPVLAVLYILCCVVVDPSTVRLYRKRCTKL